MLKFLGRLFGGNTGKQLITSAAENWDESKFTDEEKSKQAAKFGEWYLRWLDATLPQNVSRRFIAVVVTLLWAFLILVGVAARAIEMWLGVHTTVEEHNLFSAFVFTVLKEIVMNPFLVILGFYFAAHIARQWMGKDVSANASTK